MPLDVLNFQMFYFIRIKFSRTMFCIACITEIRNAHKIIALEILREQLGDVCCDLLGSGTGRWCTFVSS
jgi:hypothetical protein